MHGGRIFLIVPGFSMTVTELFEAPNMVMPAMWFSEKLHKTKINFYDGETVTHQIITYVSEKEAFCLSKSIRLNLYTIQFIL